MTSEEYEQYAIENGLVVWSKEMSERAIKALEQEPSGDLISRQAVFEQIHCWIGSGEYRYTNATHYLTERVKHIPPVKQERTGHWTTVEMTQDGCRYTVTYCSECDEDVDYRTDYCPNCGARMESEDTV